MAMTFTNRGKFYLVSNAITGSTDLRAGVITSAVVPSAAAIQDFDFVSELLTSGTGASTEAAATNYARQDLANLTITEDDVGNEVDITADAPNFAGANIGAGETWAAVFYYIEGASDAARELIAVDEPASTLATNGGTVTLPSFVASLS